jgi:hypothetical protein
MDNLIVKVAGIGILMALIMGHPVVAVSILFGLGAVGLLVIIFCKPTHAGEPL